MKILLLFFTLSISTCCHAQEWIPYQPIPQIIQPQPVYQAQYVAVQHPPIIIYQWIPQYVNQPVLVEQRFMFCKKYHWINHPTIQWVPQQIIYP